MGDNIRVAVRIRDLIEREKLSKAEIYWEAKNKTTISAINSNTTLSYDRVFNIDENNEVVYSEFCAPIVESVVNGFNGTIFAYGQTSSGKTYTLMGDGLGFDHGIVHHTVYNIFENIKNREDREFLIRVSLMEIYNEKVIDLSGEKSNEKEIPVRVDGRGNVNVSEPVVQKPDQVLKFLKKGQKRRRTGETAMNQKSSRSHLIFRMIIESRLRDDEKATVNVSHFYIVDLAGSEKPSESAKMPSERENQERFKEGVNINKSLSTLTKVINQINQLSSEEKGQYISYRDSNLTKILKNSLGGNALTAIICNITPVSMHETLSTLKFALNAKMIKNKPQVNEIETGDSLIKSYANQIKTLTKQLEATKEEKNQEAKKRRDLQEEIQALKKKFVQFEPQNNITRSTRRETWGGCLDTARIQNLFQPSRPLKLAVVNEENETNVDGFEMDKTVNGDFFKNEMSSASTRLSSASTRLSSDSNRQSFASNRLSSASNRISSVSSIYSTSDESSKKEDAAVQTDSCSELNAEKEVIKYYEDKVTELRKELCDLKHFTTLEKQLMSDHNSKSKIMANSLNCSTLSPILEKSRKSDVNNLSDEESFGVINSLVNRKSEANRNIIDFDQEMFFQNFDIVIGKIINILNIESVSPSIENPYFKVIYQLTNIIFQKHFTGSELIIDNQVKEMLSLLLRIFVGFSNQEDLTEQNSELIINFGEMTEKLLKNIEYMMKTSSKAIATVCIENENGCTSDIINVSSESPDAKIISEKDCQVNFPSLLSCECNDQISSLEETINTHLETINHLQNNHELIKKQLTLSEDKIKIQEQVIANLENEIASKVKCCVELTDNFTQTSYMKLLNESDKEFSSKMPSAGNSKLGELNYTNCLKSQNYSLEENAPDLGLIKNELCDIRLLTRKMMEDSMPKSYTSDISINESLDTTSSVDLIMAEIGVLKNMYHRIRFYIKDRSERTQLLENQMVERMSEISSLQNQCSALQEKESQLQKLHADLHEFRKEISERKLSMISLSPELECHDLFDIKYEDDITYLKRVVKCFADAVVDRHSALEELLQKLASKESKITQTVENYPDLAALEQVRAHEFKERTHLCKTNTSLKLKVEELRRKVEDLEQDLKLNDDKISEIRKSYEEEIEENLSHHKEVEKNWKETMQKHIKDIEDKYEEELKTQEKSLFDMMDKKLKLLREEKDKKLEECKKLEEHNEEVVSLLKAKLETLKSDMQYKLEEIDDHEKSKLKLQAEIRDFKNREETARNGYYKLKNKFQEYVRAVQNMRMANAKCVKEKEVQTSFEIPSAEVSNECRTLKQEQKELKSQNALKCLEMVSLETKNKNMEREIAALKKDLAAKSALLLNCNCKLFARPQDLVPEDSLKTKNRDAADLHLDKDQLRKIAALNPKEVLKLEIVQKAINEARESERSIFNSGEGPASQEMCILLQRKIAKRDKEISELKSVVSQKQFRAAPVKNHLEKVNVENIPLHPIDVEILENFTPSSKTVNKYSEDAVLKVQPKKVLHEVNPQNEVPRNKWFMTEEESKKAKELEENLRKCRGEPDCKQQ